MNVETMTDADWARVDKARAKRKRRAEDRKGPGYMRESFSYYGSWNARPAGERARDRWNRRREARS